MNPVSLRSARLLLRPWRSADHAAFAALNADPDVMRHFPSLLTREQSDAIVARIDAHFEQHGFGLWAVEVEGGPEFIGFVGLSHARFDAPFTPAVEIGWRLSRAAWGQGYATEAAKRALAFGFDELGLNEIVSFTITANTRSFRVMERIGMQRDLAGDFDHPLLPDGHVLKRHILYRMRNPALKS